MKKRILCVSAILLMCSSITGCASWDRMVKDVSSDVDGGIDRTITVYDYSGNTIATYEGKIDIQESDGNKVKFDLNGKRTIIYGGIIISQEN